MVSIEARFRRFARAVTTEFGALDESFLGRGRPLGAARVLNAIGHGRTDVTSLRTYLKLDSGLMSRLLRSLELEALIETNRGADDARRRVVRLTPKGQSEVFAYEELSDARANAVLKGYRDMPRLLDALDLVATALTRDQVEIEPVLLSDPKARYCLDAYYAELQSRFAGGFDVTRSRDPHPEQVSSPCGVFLVAMSDGLPIGCVALVGTGSVVAEVKRLWVSAAARGCGVARGLMEAVEQAALDRGVRLLRLDTNAALSEACDFYRRAGWSEIARFNNDPYADYFFEKAVVPND